jgi:DeoR family transcriptional regulator, suf operon transcriptional repressor
MSAPEVLQSSQWYQGDVPPLISMPAARRAFILALNRRGEARAEDLSRDMLLSLSAVRAQLITLSQEGLVSFRRVRAGRGRPKHLFRLTPAAEGLLPNRYREMLVSVLLTLESEAPTVLDSVFEQISAQFNFPIATAERVLALAPQDRIAEVLPYVQGLGFQVSQADEGESVRFTIHHCPLLAITTRFQHPCASELRWYQSTFPEALVERTAHRPGGDDVCAFVVTLPARA